MEIGPPVLEKKIFEGLIYHIRAWRPSWLCDPDAANKLSLPLPKEDPHKIFGEDLRALWTTTDGRRTMSIL